MLNQKDNDFDDLFRRASDKYPLRTDSADWNRMAAALDNPPPDLPDTGEDRRRKRRFLWFFLLLPLGGVGYYALHQAGFGHGHPAAGNPSAQVRNSTGPSTPAGAGRTAEGTVEGTVGGARVSGGTVGEGTVGEGTVGEGTVGEGTVGEGTVGGGTVASGTASTGAVGTAANSSPGAGGVKGGRKINATSRDNGNAIVKSGEDVNAIAKSGYNNINDKRGHKANAAGGKNFAGNRRGSNAGHVTTGSNDSVADGNSETGRTGNSPASTGAVNGGATVSAASRVASYPVNRARISKDYNLTVNVEAPVMHKDSSKTKPKASSKQKSSFLYAGLLAAPDLSTVKFQSTKGMGTTFSLLLGYQFNKKWAIESGVSVDRKRYYTEAQYFKAPTNPNWTLQNVDGTCYMWEIPVNVRYNFSQSEKSKWFATAGLSTYLMTKENYTYQYTQNGWSGSYNKDITKPSQYWFSIINLSAGYEHRLGRIGNLRIEPYLRVPLSGLGTGKLNILSTGLNIGITRRLW